MTVLVLSVLSSVLEDELARQATETGSPMPIVCMPAVAATYRANTQGPRPYRTLVIDSLHDATALRRLAAHVEGHVTAVATTNECALQAAAILRAHLGIPGMDLATAAGFTDKYLQKRTLAAAGIPVADFTLGYRPEDVQDAINSFDGWAVVIKPRLGFNGLRTHIVSDTADLDALRAAGVFIRDADTHHALAGEYGRQGLATTDMGFLIEEYIAMRAEYHCEILRLGGTTVYAIVGRYSQPCLDENDVGIAGGFLLDPGCAEATAVRNLALAAADALGLPDGCAHAEIFRAADGEWILGEIAARPGGFGIQPTIGHAYTGIDLPRILAAVARGEQPPVHAVLKKGTFGWAAALSRPARLERITTAEDLCADPRVQHAEIMQQPGTIGEPGSMPVAYAYLHTDTPERMQQALQTAPDLFDIAWSAPATVAA